MDDRLAHDPLRPLRQLLWGLAASAVLLAPSRHAAAQDADLTPAERLARRQTPVVEVFQAAKGSVVNISATQIVEDRSPLGMGSRFDEFFDFPMGQPRQVRRTSLGSGFVLHRDGYVVTNAHVVALTVERKVIFDDRREYEAQVVAIDAQRDLALLKIDADGTFTPLPLGTSSDLMVGETVIAIGNPMGYGHTVTAGVVSATDRELAIDPRHQFAGLVQTDASINPGNSGGPLLNVLGELVGINTAIRGDAQNIGFAIPVDQLREALPELIDVERRYRITAGLRVSTDRLARVLGLAVGSPADEAGVEVDDRIIEIAGQPVTSGIDYHIALIGRRPGEQLTLTLQRGEQTLEATITFGERPRPDGNKLLRQRFGITAQAVTPAQARQIGLPRLRGLLVVEVAAGSPAARLGLEPGDVLHHLDRYAVETLEDAGEMLERLRPGQRIALGVLRFGRNIVYQQTVTIQAR